jgi:hypothetical protein
MTQTLIGVLFITLAVLGVNILVARIVFGK